VTAPPEAPTAAPALPAGLDAGADEPGRTPSFTVHLAVFEGPFDLLLSLIAKHRLDITEVALAQVTDEFLAHVRAAGTDWDLGQTTEFLVVAATLLDLKVARLLPGQVAADEEDLALLEARDLLFARLLQYRAYKQAAALLEGLMRLQARSHPRDVAPEDAFRALLPELVITTSPDGLAKLAAAALAPKPEPTVRVDHVHAPRVSVREQAGILIEALRRRPVQSFRSLCTGCESMLEVVGRFLALLELYRERRVAFAQAEALGELQVRLTEPDDTPRDTPDEGPVEPIGERDLDEEYG
jgi:segregation and condensation protein A